ncbi:MAG: hypothetical protein ABJA82_00455 [Myxococcales bacterium]
MLTENRLIDSFKRGHGSVSAVGTSSRSPEVALSEAAGSPAQAAPENPLINVASSNQAR